MTQQQSCFTPFWGVKVKKNIHVMIVLCPSFSVLFNKNGYVCMQGLFEIPFSDQLCSNKSSKDHAYQRCRFMRHDLFWILLNQLFFYRCHKNNLHILKMSSFFGYLFCFAYIAFTSTTSPMYDIYICVCVHKRTNRQLQNLKWRFMASKLIFWSKVTFFVFNILIQI